MQQKKQERQNDKQRNGIFGGDRGSMKRFFAMLWKAKIPYVWIIGYLVLSAILSNVGIGVTEYTAELFAGNVAFGTVVFPFLFYKVLSLIIGSVSGILNDLCRARIDRNLRRMLWKKTIHLPLSFYTKSKGRELISRITTDISVISQLIMQVFVAVLMSMYTLVITLRKIASYDRKLMLSLVAVIPLNLLITFIMGKIKFGVSDLVNRRNAQLTGTVSERMKHFLLIKSLGNEEKEYRYGEEKAKNLYRSEIMNAWTQFASPMYAIAGMMQFMVIVMVGRGFYQSGALSLTMWIAYYGFGTSIVNILASWCSYWTTLKSSQGATNRVATVMQEPEENIETGENAEKLEGEIELREVGFSYGDSPLFEKLNITIPKGRVTAVIGPSGSGKTTLLNLLDRFYQLKCGNIFFGGEDVEKYSLKFFRRQISYVTQETVLFGGSVRENLLFGLAGEASDEELREACEKAGIWEFIEGCPGGLDWNVGENGELLSGGQKQRIALARAFLENTSYLFLDEAMAAMDVRSKDQIWKEIRKRWNGKTVFMVTHDRQTIKNADYIIVLENGAVQAAGDRAEIARTNAYYQELMGREE